MKGDFSRRTFDRRKHYSGVQMQQGRVQLDADWNEQSDILAHRAETEAQDVIGDCGAPLHEAGFHVVAASNDLTAEEKNLAGNKTPPPPPTLQAGGSDFFISAGRYYVDGVLCDNERITTYRGQNGKDLPDPELMTQNGLHLVYLDVWQRHITALDDPSIREVALGGPDAATRIKTVWQVKWWRDANADANCLRSFDRFKAALPQRDGKLSAQAQPAGTNPNPCVIPPSAGYRGLENQLYRVEVHQPGAAYDVAGGVNVFNVTALPQGTPNQVTVGAGTWKIGDVVEVFRTVAGSDPMAGLLAQVVAVSGANNRTLTLNRDLPGLTLTDLPKVRRAAATFKWSRDNGSVVTAIEKINGNQITVHDLGPDSVLGFAPGQWVEITDDGFELNAKPAQLAQIAALNPGTRIITLKAAATPLGTVNGVNPDRHPKLRRWDGIGTIKRNPPAGEDWQNLEDGIQAQFSAGNYVTGDYWLIPARTATAEADSGSIEWPRGAGGSPLSLPPAGIEHHYCPLGLLNRTGTNLTTGGDCRCVFSPLTHLTGFFYVGGDGQEAMPGDPMPQLLQVGVFNVGVSNVCTPVTGARVRFTAQGNGRVAATLAGLPASASNTIEVVTGPDGIASCAWRLAADPNNPATWTPTSQQVEARLLDANGVALDPVVRFTANLSIAAQVAYDPGPCGSLKGDNTVQNALTKLSGLTSLFYVSGSGQEVMPGETLQPLVVLTASPCGPVAGATVQFKVLSGGGSVNPASATTQADGTASCNWTLGPNVPNQEVEATLVPSPGRPDVEPKKVRFIANLSLAGHIAYTPPVDCPDLKDAATVQAALDTLCRRPTGCAVTVRPDQEVTQVIKELIDAGRSDLCLCLQPGDHKFSRDLAAATQPGIRLEIVGCGPGTRLALSAPFNAVQLAAVTLRDLDILVTRQDRRMRFDRCGRVTLDGCHVVGVVGSNSALCLIQAAERITLTNNVMEAHRNGVRNPAKIFEANREIAALFGRAERETGALLGRREFLLHAAPFGEKLAGNAPERQRLLAQIREKNAEIERLSQDERASYIELMGLLSAQAMAPREFVLGLAKVRDAAAAAAPGIAVVIEDGDADTRLEDNDIVGVVSLYGLTDGSALTQDHLRKLKPPAGVPSGVPLVTLVPSSGALHFRNNRVTRVTLGAEMLKQIRDFTPVPAGNLILRRVYRTCYLTDNILGAENNTLVMRHLVLTANDFDTQTGDAGASIADSAIYVGNHAPGDIRLFSLARAQQLAANLILNIVPI